MNTHLRSNPAR